MTAGELIDKAIRVLNFCVFYETVLLVRRALVSAAALAAVIALRKTILKNRVFLKGAAWALFLPVLFAGKLRCFDESGAGMIFSYWWRGVGIKHIWVCWLYFCAMALYAAVLFGGRRKLNRLAAGMKRGEVEGTAVYVADIPVTPATIGVFRPKIVIPEAILREYGREELETIMLHEKLHIRLGHLYVYLFWDVLRVLLWINPLLAAGTKYLREDMEEICDRVTIQRSGGNAYAYGQLLLKSMRTLRAETDNLYAAFSGDTGYQNTRRRITSIAGYTPYKRAAAAGAIAAAALCAAGAIAWTQNISYARNIENESMLVYGYDNGEVSFVDYDSDTLCRMISYDDRCVYVNREAFDRYLYQNRAEGEIFVVFGGFVKLPGIGGIGYTCQYEGGTEKIIQIPYDNREDDWLVSLCKLL